MNTYLYTAISEFSQFRPSLERRGDPESFQIWQSCPTFIIAAESPEAAQQKLETQMHRQPEGESPLQVEIKKIVACQFIDQMFTESGNVPLDWPAIFQQARVQVESAAVDDFEQGYWVDVEPVLSRENLSPTIDDLQRALPEDISSGLNWSADKQFLYVLSLLTPPIDYNIPLEPGATDPQESEESENEKSDAFDPLDLQNLLAAYPWAADKQAAAMVQARNSVVAAWLWRRYAAGKELATLPIRIDPFFEPLGFPDTEENTNET